ncbi:hypothetical protein N0G65_000131 [Providencia rettgeri]|nr:hypothetical protein [Providencia rettgeri]
MKKIALLLAAQSLLISSLAVASIDKEGYQTVGDIKIKYPKEFIYSHELTAQLKSGLDAQFSKSELSVKSVSGYIAEPVCNLTSAMITETQLSDKPAATAEQMANGSNDAIKSLPNTKVITSLVKKLNIDGLDATRNQITINNNGTLIYSDGIQAISTNENKTMQVAFVGFTQTESDVQEMQKCVDGIIDTIQYVK